MHILNAKQKKTVAGDSVQPSVQGCTCGYRSSRIIPSELCFLCGDRALSTWVATERKLLSQIPIYAEEVRNLVRTTAALQRKAILTEINEPADHAAWERSKAGKQLARLRRKHRTQIKLMDQSRWNELADLVMRDPRASLRAEASRLRKRGLGAAMLTMLSAKAAGILFRRLRR